MLPGLPRLLEELQPDVIFHLAGVSPPESLEAQLRTHVLGTRYLLQSLVDTQQSPVVVIPGSSCEYGPYDEPVDELAALKPETEHGVVKASQTQIARVFARDYNLPVVIGRLFHVYGANQGNLHIAPLASQIARCEKKYVKSPRIRVRNLVARHDFVYIGDVVEALYALSEHGRPGEIYNIANNQAVSVQEVLSILLRNSRLKNVEIDLFGDPIPEFSQGRINKIDIHTGWKPKTSLEQGLASELAYWRDQASLLTVDV
jgi:GDP-4-dehydro-6-deoxy-D-mannose reductase